MESLILVLGCLLSFLLGAYIRQPFNLPQNRCSKRGLVDDTEAKADALAKEFANLMSYNGGKQVDDEL